MARYVALRPMTIGGRNVGKGDPVPEAGRNPRVAALIERGYIAVEDDDAPAPAEPATEEVADDPTPDADSTPEGEDDADGDGDAEASDEE